MRLTTRFANSLCRPIKAALTTRICKTQSGAASLLKSSWATPGFPLAATATKRDWEQISMYLTTLRDDGVLCMHTSNRHMDLVRPVARIVMELNKERKEGEPELKCVVGKDDGSNRTRRGREGPNYLGHFGSEYVMIY